LCQFWLDISKGVTIKKAPTELTAGNERRIFWCYGRITK